MQPAKQNHDGVDRRAHPRTGVELFGRCLLANKLEIPCQTKDISATGVGVTATHSPAVGEPVIVYLYEIGRIEGTTVRVFDDGFALVIGGSDRTREKVSAKINRLTLRPALSSLSERRDERLMPAVSNSQVKLLDGSIHETEIVDISLSGAALKIKVRPIIGSKLTLAGMRGKVVRYIEEGIAVEFL